MSDNNLIVMLKKIDSRLERIEKLLEENRKSSKKMDTHIDFIDNVYNTVRMPFSNVLSICSGNKVEISEKYNNVEDIV
jgi:hypothetical protein